MLGYIVAQPDEYLAITGAGIKDIKIVKASVVLPFQKCSRFSIQPRDYPLDLQAMTIEKLQFLLPVVFTVGPHVQRDEDHPFVVQPKSANDLRPDDDHSQKAGDALRKFAMLLAQADHSTGPTVQGHIKNIVTGIIEGETRVLVSTMTMEEIFTGRDEFKKKIFNSIQSELDQFGLKIYNANIRELRDAPGSHYFESLSRKAHEGAINQARIDVADAQRKGNVGEAQRKGEQNREIAKIDAETAVQRTERDSEKARAEATLATRTTNFNKEVSIAQIEATRATEVRDEELRKDVEVVRAQTELERMRASDVVKATISRESKQQAADAKLYEEQARSNAALYSEQRSADAHAYKVRIEAEAKYLAAAKDAEADFIRQQKAAAGLSAMAGAYSDLSHAFGGPSGLIQYLMIEKGIYTDLAKANADAIRGLNPKMTIWNTGSNAGGERSIEGGENSSSMGGMDSIRNMYQMLPPLMTTIQEQTNVTLPEWQFGKLATQISDRETTGAPIKGMKSQKATMAIDEA